MTVREFINNVVVRDNVLFKDKVSNEELFNLVRNFERVTEDKIPEGILNMEFVSICGSAHKYKVMIYCR